MGQAVLIANDMGSGPNTWCVNVTMYSNGTWTQTNGIHTSINNMAYLDCAIDDSGRAAVVDAITLNSTFGIYGNAYAPGLGWTGWNRVDYNNYGMQAGFPHLVLTDGRAIVAYSVNGPQLQVWASTYDFGTAPAPSITLDRAGGDVTQPVYVITGKVTHGSSLTVNGLTVAMTGDGRFNTAVQLQNGNNTIDCVAVNAYGKTTTLSISVRYTDPAIALQDGLDQARDKANNAETLVLIFGIIGVAGLAAAMYALLLARRKT